MSEASNRKLSGGLALAAIMFSTYIGPGYASGTQTVAFYLTKGWIGVFVAPIILGIITYFWCYMVFNFNRVYRPKNYREQSDMIYRHPVARQLLGIFKEVVSFAQVFIVVSAMISAAAILMNTMLGLPVIIGTIFFSLLIILLTMKGTSLVKKVSTLLTIVILAIVAYIALIAIGPTLDGMKEFVAARSQPEDYGFTKIYAWYIIMGSVFNFLAGHNAAVPACLDMIKSKRDAFIAAMGNAVLCTGATIICTVIFSAGMPHIAKEPLPMIYALQEMVGAGAWVQYLYFIIALAAMLSTGVALVYGMVERWSPVFDKKLAKSNLTVVRLVVSTVLVLVSMLLSKVGILALVGTVYPIFFNVSTPVIFFLLFITIPYRIYKDKKNGVYPEEATAKSAETASA